MRHAKRNNAALTGTDKLFEALLERITENSAMDFHAETEKDFSAKEILYRALELLEEEMKLITESNAATSCQDDIRGGGFAIYINVFCGVLLYA